MFGKVFFVKQLNGVPARLAFFGQSDPAGLRRLLEVCLYSAAGCAATRTASNSSQRA